MKQTIVMLFFSGLFFSACMTDDVEPLGGEGPLATLTADQASILENGGVVNATVTLAERTDVDITVKINFGGDAIGGGTDYSISSNQIVIPAGSLSGSLTITAVDDTEEESNEAIELNISEANGAGFVATDIVQIIIEDDDGQTTALLVLNEICYDPSNSGLEGDCNGDGVYSQAQDEFLEFINLSSQALDVSGWKIFDQTNFDTNTPRHVIPTGTIINAGQCFVVFGGGTPTGTFGGALVQTTTTGNMNMSNAGDNMYLVDAAGNQVIVFDIDPLSDNPNESYTRSPDISGTFEQHGDVSGVLFSPGTKIDGSSF